MRSARQWAISLARPWRPVAVLGDEHARVAADPGQGQDEPRLVQRCYVGGGQADQVGGTLPVGPAGAQDRFSRRSGRDWSGAWPGRATRLGGDRGEHAVLEGGELARRDRGVNQPVSMQVLGPLGALGESRPRQGLVGPRAEEADQRARLGHGEMPKGPQEANTPPVVGCRR